MFLEQSFVSWDCNIAFMQQFSKQDLDTKLNEVKLKTSVASQTTHHCVFS